MSSLGILVVLFLGFVIFFSFLGFILTKAGREVKKTTEDYIKYNFNNNKGDK